MPYLRCLRELRDRREFDATEEQRTRQGTLISMTLTQHSYSCSVKAVHTEADMHVFYRKYTVWLKLSHCHLPPPSHLSFSISSFSLLQSLILSVPLTTTTAMIHLVNQTHIWRLQPTYLTSPWPPTHPPFNLPPLPSVLLIPCFIAFLFQVAGKISVFTLEEPKT